MPANAIIHLEIRQLRAFVAVAEELSFVRAAKRLNVAQPALSRTIRDIEGRLGVHLFERTTRAVYLTEAGKVFLLEARHTLTQMERAVQLTREAEAGLSGEIRIGYMDFAMYGPMIDLLKTYKRRNPGVKLNLQRRRSDEQSNDLAAHRLDVGFTVRHRFHREVEPLLLTREPLVAVLPRNHRLAKKKRLSIADMADEPFIMGDRDRWQIFLPMVEAFCSSVGFAPKISVEANEGAAIFRLVAAGQGVSIYPACARQVAFGGLAVRDFEEEAPIVETFGIVRRGGYPPMVDSLVNSLRDIIIAGGETAR
jgi:DNA-binding transcriptional LysR family regulator